MDRILSRLAALLAGLVIARLTGWGLVGAHVEAAAEVEAALRQLLEILLLLAYVGAQLWLEARARRADRTKRASPGLCTRGRQ